MNDKVNFIDIIEKYDISTEPFSEHEISDNLRNVDKDNSKNPEYEWLPEVMAFDFTENYSNDETGWGTYYGPLMVIPNQDGTVTETPSIKNITDEIIAYWIKRADKAKNPILKTRYADLVWDFSKIVTGKQCDYKYACMVIDNTIEVAEKDLYKYDIFVITKLERAISLALALNDDARLRKLTETIIKYEQKIQEDNKPGTWGFAYRILVKNKKVKLPQDLENKIIGDLEKRWQKLNQAESKNPFAIETLSLDLADYYRRNNKNDDLRRVVISIGEAYKGVSKKAEPLLASSWLQKVHAIYSQFGFNSEAQEITRIISELGPKTRDSLKEISHEVKIPKEEIDKYIEETIDGDLETVLTKIAIRFIPSKSEAERELIELSKKVA